MIDTGRCGHNPLVTFVKGFNGCWNRRKHVGQRLNPNTQVVSRYADRAGGAFAVFENGEHVCGEVLCHSACHAAKPAHDELDRVGTIEAERRTGTLACICPWIVMVKPNETMSKHLDENGWYLHVDEHDTQGPNVGGIGAIAWSHVVSAF